MLGSAYVTLKHRGAGTLLCAIVNIANANLQKLVLGRRFIERKIHNYRRLLDLEDKGISRSLRQWVALQRD